MGEDVSIRPSQAIAAELTRETNADRVIALAKELTRALTLERQSKQQNTEDATAD